MTNVRNRGKWGLTGVERDMQCIRNFISTPKGSIPMDRDFGIDSNLLDKPVEELQGIFTGATKEMIEELKSDLSLSDIIINKKGEEIDIDLSYGAFSDNFDLMTKQYEKYTDLKVVKGSPEYFGFRATAHALYIHLLRVKYLCNQALVTKAIGKHLDLLGDLTNTKRILPKRAFVKIRFEGNAYIQQGFEISDDNGEIVFEVPDSFLLEGSEEIVCTCKIEGEIGNGFEVGAIKNPTKQLPGLLKVENIEVSSGGGDIEDDERYRDRLIEAPNKFTTCGSKGSYEYWVKSVHESIRDVFVDSPSPGVVDIYVLKDDKLTDSNKESILEVLEDVRPITDKVAIKEPVGVEYDIQVSYMIRKMDKLKERVIKDNVEKEVEKYVKWQSDILGRDTRPYKLSTEIESTGAIVMDLDLPKTKNIKPNEIAVVRNINLEYLGLTDEK